MFEAQGGDASKRPHGKKSRAARVAAVSRDMQNALERREYVLGNAIAGDVLEIEITAPRAMHVNNVREGHQPGIKADAASPTAPRAQGKKAPEMVLHSAALRAAARPAMAIRTEQFGVPPGCSHQRS